MTVFNPAPGGGSSKDVSFTVIGSPVPVITSLDPASAVAGGPAFTLTVNGSGFVLTNGIPGSIVRWNNSNRTTTYVSATRLTAMITAADIATAGTASVTVFNPAPGGGTSNAVSFAIRPVNPVPTITALNPASATAGSPAFTLAVTGTNFANGSIVRWNEANRPTTFVSGAQLTALIPATDIATAGTASVTVFNPAPGGGTSNAVSFAIVAANPVPTITSLNPATATAGSAALTLTVNGTNFVTGSTVRWNGGNRPTTFISSNQLTAAISAADVATAGAANITVFNPAPGGRDFQWRELHHWGGEPRADDYQPESGYGHGRFGGLYPDGQWDRFRERFDRALERLQSDDDVRQRYAADGFDSGRPTLRPQGPRVLRFSIRRRAAGLPTPPRLRSGRRIQAPTITSLNPATATAGSAAFTLTVTGTNFVNGSVVRWNESNRTTTFVSGTQLTAAIPATDVATMGTAGVVVFNPAPGGGTSNTVTFTILQVNPVPAITGLSPASVVAGSPAFSLTVTGTNFVSGSVVRWNGTNRTTTFIGGTQLTAAIPADRRCDDRNFESSRCSTPRRVAVSPTRRTSPSRRCPR